MDDLQRYWLGQARLLKGTVNAVLWVERWIIAAISAHFVFAGVLLMGRRMTGFDAEAYVWAYGVLWIGLATWGLFRMRGAAYTTHSALSRLEVHYGLYGQLSSASEGKAEWPERPFKKQSPVVFQGTPTQGWFLLSLAVLGIAAVLPVGREIGTVLAPDIESPPDMTTVETWLEVLKEDPALDPAALEKFEDQLESLQNEDPASWYDQASLEAASALRQDLEHSLGELADKLDQAHMAIDDAADPELGQESGNQMTLGPEALSALSALPQGAMPWRDALLDQLTAEAGQGPMQLSSEAMEALKQSMSQTQNTAQTLADIGTMQRLTQEEMQQLMAQCQNPEAGEGDQPGTGGITRGPGTAPLLFNPDDLPFLPENFQGVSNSDLSRASIGETIDTRVVSLDEQDQNDIETGILQGAQQMDSGMGGTATWQQSLTPVEAARLKKFFQRDTSP